MYTVKVHDRRLKRILDFIQSNHTDPRLSLRTAAGQVRLSTYHFSRWLKHETGTGFSQHLRAARVAHARVLLETTDLSVKEIAGAVGYNNTNALDRNFKAALTATPREYRNRMDGYEHPRDEIGPAANRPAGSRDQSVSA
jgi:transcriptional regulator GlxA family with amidase domain